MNTQEYKQAVESALKDSNFHEAFRLLRVMLPADAPLIRANLDAAREDYSRIISFALTGAPDPGRAEQITALRTRLYGILDMLLRENMVADSSSLYFSTLRTNRLRRSESVSSLLVEYQAAARAASAFRLATLPRAEADAARRVVEDLEPRLFMHLWTTTPLSLDELAALRSAMLSPEIPLHFKQLTVSALTLSLLEFFSEPLLKLLLQWALPDNDPALQVRATVGAVLVMSRWPRRSNTNGVRPLLDTLREHPQWSADVEHIIMQLVRSANVEEIARTMRSEIIPEMMKLRPDIEKHIQEAGLDLADFESNPEWEEKLSKSGLQDRLRKLSEMQMEGGDLFYTAFAMLKSYPFFSFPSSWFLPFNTDRTDVRAALGHDDALALLIADAEPLCESDKYSFIFSLDRLPDAQKQMVMNQISSASMQMSEMFDSELTPERVRRNSMLTRYIQDVYRFFKLFRRRAEFRDPFLAIVNPAAIPTLRADFARPDKIRLLAEFFFKHNHLEDALSLFRMLPPDATIHQKIGHSLERLQRPREALEEYRRAELLAPDSRWTLRRLAQVSKTLGDYRQALEYYGRLEQLDPDRVPNALAMGHCHLQLNELHEALHCYYKAEMLDESSPKPLRPIAWVAFLSRDFDTARRYYDRLLSAVTPAPGDYLNLGHLALATGRVREAVNYYKLYADGNEPRLASALANDAPLLAQAGVQTDILPLLLDSIRFDHD